MNASYGAGIPRRVSFGWIAQAWQIFGAQAGVWIVSALIYGFISIALIYAIELTFMFRFIFPTFTASAPGMPVGAPSTAFYTSTTTITPMFWVLGVLITLVGVAVNAFFWGGMLKMANSSVRGLPVGVGTSSAGATPLDGSSPTNWSFISLSFFSIAR